eukprot:GDKH01015670.1.p1 GENE.GDKH01015670.1~~GDKH01015670.1.p1  ORF type:complete len:129 (+),score=31.17 GDKH01015670.1:233-619(+)
MLNFIPRKAAEVSLLYGKRPIQRVEIMNSAGKKEQIEIPTSITDDIYSKTDAAVLYSNGAYQPMQWKDFVSVKLDAMNLCGANVSSALTDLDWYPKVAALYAGQKSTVQSQVATKISQGLKLKYPVMQ